MFLQVYATALLLSKVLTAPLPLGGGYLTLAIPFCKQYNMSIFKKQRTDDNMGTSKKYSTCKHMIQKYNGCRLEKSSFFRLTCIGSDTHNDYTGSGHYGCIYHNIINGSTRKQYKNNKNRQKSIYQ